MSESHANLAEGLAVTLNCFQDITEMYRENDMPTQKNCILIANSAPYSMPVQDCLEYENKTYEQLAGIFLEVFSNQQWYMQNIYFCYFCRKTSTYL